ncbi:MAG: ribonuclease HI family protein [Candidatus Omnitrophica bacterium]|jgi:ribonuclease HI|nr:ribonuclease HI family protein [Candidatus Omnitrophota bacterium]
MRKLEIYIDGASKGNPGHAGIGVIILEGEQVICNIARYIGEATNNIAEYTALIYALEEALKLKAGQVEVKTDSQLLHRQVIKEYKVKDKNIAVLYGRVTRLLESFPHFKIEHIPREENKGADKLATIAVKEKLRETAL